MPLLLLFFTDEINNQIVRAFFSIDKKKKILACIQILFKLETNFQSKQIVLFCFVFFLLDFGFVFLFLSLIYFILFYYFFCGGARSFYRSPVQCYWYCQYLTIFYKSHICQRNANEIYAEENNQCLRFCHRMYFTQRTYHERKEIS